MNNQGQTNDNLHVGDVLITDDLEVKGDVTVDGSLVFNSVQANEICIDGYCLPTSAGVDGEVITMNADNKTTSFKPISIPSLVDQRICLSRWFTQYQSLLNFSAYIGIFLNSNTGDSTTTGSNVIPASDFITSEENYTVLHVQFILRINTTDVLQPNQWQCKMRLSDGVGLGEIEWEPEEFSGTVQTNSERIQDFYLTFIRNPADPTKINISNQCIKHTNEASTTAPTGTNADKLFLSNNQFKLGSETGDISMPLPTTKSYWCQYNNFADGRPLTIDFLCQRPNPNASNTIDYGVLVGELYTFKKQTLPSGGPVTNDHLLLSNLNGGTGDGGHINLYDRRGVKPMTGDVNMNGNDITNCSDILGQGVNRINLNPPGQMTFISTISAIDGSSQVALSSNGAVVNRISGTDKLLMTASGVQVLNGSLDMKTNDIIDANVIVRASNGNVIDMDNDIAPPLITGALTIDAGAGKQARLSAGSVLELDGNVIDYNSKGGNHQFSNTAEGTILTLGSEIGANKNLNMLLNNIDQCPQVSNGGGVLSLFGDGRTDIGIIAGGSRLEVEDTQVSVSPFADLVIQNNIRYVQPGVMPTVFDDGATYVFVGSRTTATPIVLNNISVTFKGTSRDTSAIEYTGAGSFITATDCNLTISDLELKCNVAGSLLLTASNPSKLKVLSISNCEVTDSYEFADISGHELVDVNNCLFIHLRGNGVLTNQKCLYINGVAKTNVSSCELVKFFEIGQPANTNPFDGAMIYITGACGAISIIGGIIHPRVNQRAVEIDNTATFLEFALNTNNFIDIGLTTGAILQTNLNLDWDTNATSEANSLLPNLKSFVGAQLSAQNTNNTATVLNNPIDINLGALLTPFSSFGTAVAGTGGVTYVRKRPVNFQVTFVANLQAITGGSGQRIALSVSKNGVNTGIKSFVTLDSAGTEPKQCTLTLVGQAEQGDIFRSQLINESTSSDIRCLDLLISGIEI